jgi:hypothetical protein
MVVKVVSEKPVKTIEVMCTKCHYQLQFTPIDITRATYTSYGDTEVWYYIVCPREECRNKVEVSSKYYKE